MNIQYWWWVGKGWCGCPGKGLSEQGLVWVSRQGFVRAIIYRLNQYGMITPSQYRTANIYLSKRGYTKEERYDDQVSLDYPELLPNSLSLLLKSYGLNFGGLLKELGVKAKFLIDLTQTDSILTPLLNELDLPENITSISAYKFTKSMA